MSHSTLYPGLQNHSVGEIYPLSIVLIGDRRAEIRNLVTNKRYGVHVLGQGEDYREFLASIETLAVSYKRELDAERESEKEAKPQGSYYFVDYVDPRGENRLNWSGTEDSARECFDSANIASLYFFVPRQGFRLIEGKHHS